MGDASGTTGGGAGIYLPSDSSFWVKGVGALDVTGGKGGSGLTGDACGSGSRNAHPIFDDYFSGKGGNGGNGGTAYMSNHLGQAKGTENYKGKEAEIFQIFPADECEVIVEYSKSQKDFLSLIVITIQVNQ